jgi:hypothetical protein
MLTESGAPVLGSFGENQMFEVRALGTDSFGFEWVEYVMSSESSATRALLPEFRNRFIPAT